MKLLAIPLGCQPRSFWPGTRKTAAKWLVISRKRQVTGYRTLRQDRPKGECLAAAYYQRVQAIL